jgi:hypothetical protein
MTHLIYLEYQLKLWIWHEFGWWLFVAPLCVYAIYVVAALWKVRPRGK